MVVSFVRSVRYCVLWSVQQGQMLEELMEHQVMQKVLVHYDEEELKRVQKNLQCALEVRAMSLHV